MYALSTAQVPSRNVPTPDESLAEFYEDIPALGLLGTPHCIYPECPFEVDADVQLVCKYLHAHHVGGTKGIDRLFRESGCWHATICTCCYDGTLTMHAYCCCIGGFFLVLRWSDVVAKYFDHSSFFHFLGEL